MSCTDTRIRVMILTPCFGFGGLERVILGMVANIDRTRFSPLFCTIQEPEKDMYRKIEDLDIPCFIIEKGEGMNYSLPFKLSRLMRRERIDLVNSHDIGATLFAATAARLAGVKRVVHTDHSQILTITRFASAYHWIIRHLVSHSITVSKDLEEFFANTISLDINRITTIPNGIDISRFTISSDSSSLRKEFGIAKNTMVVGTIGRLMEQKGTEYLIRACAQLKERYPDFTLVLVGEGELRTDLEGLTAGLGMDDKIIFTGIRDDTPELLNLFDLFVLPSLWEGQPITIIEAMAAGKPIIATDVGGNAEILQHGEFGVLVPSRDSGKLAEAMEKLFVDRPMARKLGELAQVHAAAELTSASMTRRYEDIFLSLFPERDR